jgi:hypothetical protein
MARAKEIAITLSGTSPGAASTTVTTAAPCAAALNADRLVIDANLVGATGGTLDVYIQRKIAPDTWRDWIHFPQLAAAAAAIRYTATITGDEVTGLVVVGQGTDAAPGVTLAANTIVNCMPGGALRLVFVAGAGTSAGAAQSVIVTPYTSRM